MEISELKTTVENAARLEILEDRFDRHLTDTKDQIAGLGDKVDAIKTIISNLEVKLIEGVKNARIDQLKDSGQTNTKIATISGTVSLIVTIIIGAVASWFKKP